VTQDRMKAIELERICRRVEAGTITLVEGLGRAFALGAEFERLDIMHAACEGYSRARAHREALLRGDSWPPPPTR
jgi:hypothetical protein